MRTFLAVMLVGAVSASGGRSASAGDVEIQAQAAQREAVLRAMQLQRFGGRAARFSRGRSTVPSRRVRRRTSQPVVWQIPPGKFGLMLNDGTRLIGRPAKDWTAAIRTGFGLAVIPLAQIRSIESAGAQSVAIHLKNGDRVSGPLVSTNIPFETAYGNLNVPSADLVRLTSEAVQLSQATASRGRTGPSPPRRNTRVTVWDVNGAAPAGAMPAFLPAGR